MIVGFREGSSDVLDSTESLAVVLLVFLIEYLIFKIVFALSVVTELDSA